MTHRRQERHAPTAPTHGWVVECVGCGAERVLKHAPTARWWWCSSQCYRENIVEWHKRHGQLVG